MATKSNLYKRFKTDSRAKEEGRPVDFGGVVLLIRSSRSEEARALEEEINKENRHFFRTNVPVPFKTQEAQNIRRAAVLIAGFVSGATDEEGNDLPYTPANAKKLMTDLEELREMVIGAGNMHETFRVEEVAAVTENLPRASASGSSTPAVGAQPS